MIRFLRNACDCADFVWYRPGEHALLQHQSLDGSQCIERLRNRSRPGVTTEMKVPARAKVHTAQ